MASIDNNILNPDFTNKLNRVPITRETKIYRTIPKARLFQMFNGHQNTLVRPKIWIDKFENMALNSKILIGNEMVDFSFKDDVYAQCWTLHTASDAIWQIYSKEYDGIRIRTTVEKLLDSLTKATGKPAPFSCFVGRVEYMSKTQLNNFADNHFQFDFGTDGKKIVETLLVKRNAFVHEKEVRLIYHSENHTPPEKDLHSYSIDPHDLIDQIMLHPGLSDEEISALKNEIRSKTNYQGELKHSLLYRPPKGFVFKLNT